MKQKEGSFGLSGTSTYRIWCAMIERCEQKNHNRFPMYGGRGIRVCERWRNSFVAFLVDMGMRPEGMSIDRINVDGDYEPGNCRWADRKDQNRNKTNNRMLTFGGKTQCTAAWDEELGFPPGVVGQRINQYGWSVERALTTPMRGTVKTPEEVLLARKRAASKKYQSTAAWREKHKLYMRSWTLRRSLSG